MSSQSQARKFRIQAIALALALGAPFGLYWALNAGQDGVAILFALIILVSMAITVWVG